MSLPPHPRLNTRSAAMTLLQVLVNVRPLFVHTHEHLCHRVSRKGRSTRSGIFQEHSLYSNAKGSVTPEGQVSETVPLHLFLLWSPLFEAKSNVKLHRWPPGAGALAADVRYLTTVWLWGSQAYSILYLFPTCLLSASKAASHPSNKLHGTLCRADHEPQGSRGGRSSLSLTCR